MACVEFRTRGNSNNLRLNREGSLNNRIILLGINIDKRLGPCKQREKKIINRVIIFGIQRRDGGRLVTIADSGVRLRGSSGRSDRRVIGLAEVSIETLGIVLLILLPPSSSSSSVLALAARLADSLASLRTSGGCAVPIGIKLGLMIFDDLGPKEQRSGGRSDRRENGLAETLGIVLLVTSQPFSPSSSELALEGRVPERIG